MELTRGAVARPEVCITYLDTGGQAPVVVFLHGLAGSAGEFVPSARALWPEYRCVLVDQRGHGHSTRVPPETGRRAFVDDVVAVLDVVAPAQPVVLVGQSMGAHTAVLTAAAHPDRVAGLVLLEADVNGGDPVKAAAVGKFFRSWPVPFASRAEATAFLGTTALARAWAADLEPTDEGYRPRFHADVMQAILEAMHVPRWDEWAAVRAPTTVVFAAESMFTPVRQDAFVAARPGTRRIDLSGGTHDAHLDASEGWIAVLREALEIVS
ncbi:alpha/beta fold hydrolase [Kocuria rosea]|uniref:Alpha/beta hydrolase n=1 Tax=Kocuria rosea subsp. polaris TaxID=136273 RepID=A0A0A6VQ92_KOCRO|nr:alpha/beta hydrolase [Kocuria polaris]KHD96578.1 alpha/beta hydrolase [Kocuria polaris]